MVEAILREYGAETRVQWLDDRESCYRFFDAVSDDVLGFRLHQADIAVNKILCASQRRNAARDAVDLMSIVENYCSLGPLVWAAAGKRPETTPLNILRSLRSIIMGYSNEELVSVRMEGSRPVTRETLHACMAPCLEGAYSYCEEIAPIEYLGHLIVNEDNCPIEADEAALDRSFALAKPLQDYGLMVQILHD